MEFKDWGEENFIHHLKQNFCAPSPLVGIGDDCAVIPGENENAWLITTDALVEGIHFLKEEISPFDLGYKTIAVNVSDISAMGGEPKYAFLSIALPKNIDQNWICSVIQGMKKACEKWNTSLLGGDTVGSKRDLFLNLTLIGNAINTKIKYRHEAKNGDYICVTGYLGNSGAGLKALQERQATTNYFQYLINAHFHPEPNPQHGMWLASQEGVHAMMDISDGLDCDLKRLIKASQTGAIIETSRIPISPQLTHVSAQMRWDPLEFALAGGEDYCLLVTIAADAFDSIQQTFKEKFGVPLFYVGQITHELQEVVYQKNDTVIQMKYTNFDHFK